MSKAIANHFGLKRLSDRLAKAFNRHVAAAVGNDKLARTRLIKSGWKEFVTTDRSETNNANEMFRHKT